MDDYNVYLKVRITFIKKIFVNYVIINKHSMRIQGKLSIISIKLNTIIPWFDLDLNIYVIEVTNLYTCIYGQR